MLIYCIENKLNHKKYIGLTKRTSEDRWKQHLYESNKNECIVTGKHYRDWETLS